jgi:hypothetical protein
MRARIGMAMGLYWVGIVQVIDVIAMISALGAIGGLPAFLNALTKYTRLTLRWSRDLRARSAAKSAVHALCNKA